MSIVIMIENSDEDSSTILSDHDELFVAIKEGDKAKVEYLLNNNLDDLHEKIKTNQRYLQIAIQYRRTEIAKLLLDKDVIPVPETFPPFDDFNTDLIKLLLSYNINLELKDSSGLTYLHLAVKNKLINIVNILINRGANVNIKTGTDQSVLQLAFQSKNEEIINRLLQCDIDVNQRDIRQETALHYAIKFKNLPFIKIIIDKGADVNAANKIGLTALHLATLEYDIDIIKLLIENSANVSAKNLEGRTPLHLAVTNKSIKLAELFLKNGANVNDPTENGLTPLHIAVDTGYEEMVELLINKNADVNAVGKRDETPLNIAVAYEHEQIAEYLISRGAIVNHEVNNMILHMAVFNKNENLVELLLRNNVAITVNYNDGRTALHLAVEYKCSKIVKMLLEKGADINAQTKSGDTAIHIAITFKNNEICEILFKNKPDLNLINNKGKTPLYIAAKKGSLDIVVEILKLKPNIQKNKLALYYAVKGNTMQHKKIISQLLAHGFVIDCIQDSDNKTFYNFMKHSVSNGHSGIVDYLLRFGTSPNVPVEYKKNNTTTTLLHIAVDNNQLEITKSLIGYGSNVNATDSKFYTPIFYAVERSNFEIMKLLIDNKAIIDNNYRLLFIIIRKGNYTIIKEFLKHCKNVDIEDSFGTTALHLATWNEDEETIQLLLDKNIKIKDAQSCPRLNFSNETEPNIFNQDGSNLLEEFQKKIITTPLHIAAQKNLSDIVEVLLEYGYNVDSKDACGRTPLHIASLFDNTGVIEVLIEFGADLFITDEYGFSCIDYAKNGEQLSSSIMLEEIYDSIYNMDSHESIFVKSVYAADLLVKYMSRSNCMNEKKNVNFLDCHRSLKNIYQECINEIEKLKSKTIFNNITYYDILTKNINNLVVYVKNENFSQICETEIQKNEFHMYNNIMIKRIKRAKEKKLLRCEAEFYFTNILCLPELVASQIISYLSNKDLRYIKQVHESYVNHLSNIKCKKS